MSNKIFKKTETWLEYSSDLITRLLQNTKLWIERESGILY